MMPVHVSITQLSAVPFTSPWERRGVNNALAEFGNFMGGIVSVTIKSGTNSFHGDIWEFFRNDVSLANCYSDNDSSGFQANVTMLHCVEKLLDGIIAYHRRGPTFPRTPVH